jgi:hypothetical protein
VFLANLTASHALTLADQCGATPQPDRKDPDRYHAGIVKGEDQHWVVSNSIDSACCQARKRLALCVYRDRLERVAATVREATAGSSRWLGHRVWLRDEISLYLGVMHRS